MMMRLWKLSTVAIAVGASFGCGDDVSCPSGTMLVDGACMPVEDDLGMGGDMGTCTPTGEETCDGTDEDCDGNVDEGLETMSLFTDGDGDGFGGDAVDACGVLPGIVDVGGDCDDSDADVNPDATESCNGVDDDCDGGVDDGLLRAGEPVSLGIEGFVIAKQNLIPYGDGYFCAYFDATLSQGLYFLVDQTGSVTAGPLRITTEPVNNFLIFATKIDDERIAIVWPQEATGSDSDLWGRVLNPGTPAEHTEPQQVLPTIDGIPGVAVLDDRLVVWETPFSFEPATTAGRAFSYDLTFLDGMGPATISRPDATPPVDIRYVGAFGDPDAYLSLSNFEGGLVPVVPDSLDTTGELQSSLPAPTLTPDAPMEAFYVGPQLMGTNYAAAYAETIDPDGTTTSLTGSDTDLVVAADSAQYGSSHHTGPVVAVIACYDADEGGDADGECRYQFVQAEVADPISDALPLTSPTAESVGFPRLASNGDQLAAIVHNGNPADGPPDLYFVPFECPAP